KKTCPHGQVTMRRVCTGLGAREKLDSPLGPCDGSSVVHGLREHDQRARSAHSGPSLHLGSAYAPTPPGVAPRLSDRSPPRSGGLGWLPVMPVEMDPILVGGDTFTCSGSRVMWATLPSFTSRLVVLHWK